VASISQVSLSGEESSLVGRRIAVSGAGGFVGANLVYGLTERRANVHALVRKPVELAAVETTVVGLLQEADDLEHALAGSTSVIHLAGRAHVMEVVGNESLLEYRATNVEGTRRLAEAAAAVGVKRFVFISSVKVNGERTNDRPFTAFDSPAPEDAYGTTKAEAEEVLRRIGDRTGMESTIIRPPLVYGPGVKGNFARLMRLIKRGIPLPFKSVDNRRSLVSVDNLCDLIIHCIAHPRAAGQTFLVSDGEDLSTPELIGQMGEAMGCTARLFPVPLSLLRAVFSAFGRMAEFERLSGSLQVDIEHTCKTLDWSPPVSVSEGLRRAISQ
jgi:nucleoside-diphosphate-sugar epimerase